MTNTLDLKKLQFKTNLETKLPTLSSSIINEKSEDEINKLNETAKNYVKTRKDESGFQTIHRGEIEIKEGTATLYDDGKKTIKVPFWGYALKDSEPTYPGTIIEVDRDQVLEIDWRNSVNKDSVQPVEAIKVKYDGKEGEVVPQNVLGAPDGSPQTMGACGEPYFSVHQHGGKTAPKYDGGPLDMMSSGQSHIHRYENNQRASMLWYHDHAMHTTRLNAFAGLAGLYIIRDDEEQCVGLPSGKYEIPLVIQDRNITGEETIKELINAGSQEKVEANVNLLHKVEYGEEGPLEFFGPLNLVNGKIWPKHDVDPTLYRFRVLNGANSRTYHLILVEKIGAEYVPCTDVKAYQVGSDGGLIPSCADDDATSSLIEINSNLQSCLPNKHVDGLILSPAERADILIDFSESKESKAVFLINIAKSPFAGESFSLDEINNVDDKSLQDDRNPYPEVMCFNIKTEKKPKSSTPTLINIQDAMVKLPSYKKESPKFSDYKKVRTVAVVEKETPNGAVLVLWELMLATEVQGVNPILLAERKVMIDGEYFVAVAERFHDPVSIIIPEGSTERWRFINLTADTHPMHVHLVQYLPISRRNILSVNGVTIDPDDGAKGDTILGITASSISAHETITLNLEAMNDQDEANEEDEGESEHDEELEVISMNLDPNESCLKDTLRMNPGEMVELIARFDGHCGRFVYHCHLLEHEDHDMMRQFVVTRNDLHKKHGESKSQHMDMVMPERCKKMDMGEGHNMFPISVGVKS